MKTLIALAVLMVLHGFPAGAVQVDSGSGTPLTIRTGAKLVVVDVVVTDKEHHRVRGLKKEDFTVVEGHERQTIRSFEEHSPETQVTVAKVDPLPAGTFTNQQPPPHSAAVNVILIDVLNTPIKDQPFLRAQIAKYLGEMKPGTSLAVFSLNSRLVMLQGFSSDPKVLKATLEGKMPQKSVMLTAEAEQGSTPDTITDKIQEMGLLHYVPAKVLAELQTKEDREKSDQTQVRSKLTLDGLNALARFLSGIRGRKNLIWFSGAFPVSIMPRIPLKFRDSADYDAFAQMGGSEREFRETTNLMMRAQVAVYPIDSRGLMLSTTTNIQSTGLDYADNEEQFSNDSVDVHSTMERIAKDTGGRAWINSNDFSGGIEAAVEDGVMYYTLSYTPTNTSWHGELRKISVKLARAGYSLSYRQGYYADDPDSLTSALVKRKENDPKDEHGRLDESDLIRVMGHGMPAATQVIYHVSLRPVAGLPAFEVTNGSVATAPDAAYAKGPFRRYRVGFQVDPKSVVLRKGEDGIYRGLFDFAAWVLDAEGRPVTTLSRQVQVVANAEQYERLVGQTIDLNVEISVPEKGEYSIRTGVLDIQTRSVGAMEVAVARVKDLPPVPMQDERKSPALKVHSQ